MRLRTAIAIACALPLGASAVVTSISNARRIAASDTAPVLARTPAPAVSRDAGSIDLPALRASAPPDTTWLGYWTFDNGGCDAQGWTSVDITQQSVFTHVDDFAGLGGGDFGRLIPIEGNQSLWCGARPDPADYELCQYYLLPGYGNRWHQTFTTTSCVAVTGDVTVAFLLTWDGEPGYDGTRIQYALCDDDWQTATIPGRYLNRIDGQGQGVPFSVAIPASDHTGVLRLRLLFTSDPAFSDQDGMWQTDGGYILDSLTVSDAAGVVLPTELFEAEPVGAQVTASGNWEAGTRQGYGDFSGLFSGMDVLQEDPCRSDISCFWAFFNGSTANYACGGHPEQAVVPYENERGQYIANEIWSPFVPISGTGSRFEIGMDAYGVPQDPLVGWVWHVRTLDGTCPVGWGDSGFLSLGPAGRWTENVFAVDDLVDPTHTHIQVALGVFDVCHFYCGLAGSGQCHTPGPYFDNVWIRRIGINGPSWSVTEYNLFQDNFSSDGTTTGTVRADAALDKLGGSIPAVLPADSVTVTLIDNVSGLAIDPNTGFGPAAYMYVNVQPVKPGKTGAALSSDAFRWPVVDSLSHAGDTWYMVRFDSIFAYERDPYFVVRDRYCVDLNDNLFMPGDVVRFAFGAESAGGGANYYSLFTGAVGDLGTVLDNPMEFSCLPSPGADILYVDNVDGLGAQPFFDTAFDILGLAGAVDRYDIRAPTYSLENGPASRVVDPLVQLAGSYRTIIWNSGDKVTSTLGDAGTGTHSKLDDIALLKTFLDNLTQPGGLYLSGDYLASDWSGLVTPGAVDLRSVYMNFAVLDNDHTNAGLGRSPLVIGEPGGCFDHTAGPDTLVAFGGCPDVTYFDVLQETGTSTAEARYDGQSSAVVAQQTTNPQATEVGVVLSGFSFHAIRDVAETGVPARVEHLHDILTWLGNPTGTPPTGAGPAVAANALAQNVPNPFNPTTTIEFTVRERAPLTLRIYNVRGQLVKTLVDDTRGPEILHRVEWDGRNDAGQGVASGVYFYRLVTKEFTKTKKMVLLK